MARSLALTVHAGGGRPLPRNWRSLLAHLPEDLRDLYEERAALIEYDGGEKRASAERRAFECVLMQAEAEGIDGAFWGRQARSAGEKVVLVN
jgi:hypothetical protein